MEKQLPMFDEHGTGAVEGIELALDEVEPEEEAERYAYFMRPEPLEDLGPIQSGYDPLVQRETRWRDVKVGMLRNDPKPQMARCYLEPFPHLRLDTPKPLQGWYQAKLEPGHRPRPCFTEAILTQPYGGFCPVGCGFCYINSGTRGWRASGLVTVPIGYPDYVRKQLKAMRIGAAGYLSSFTDPFLPLESWYHQSQRTARAFLEEGLPVFFLSRLSYPDWAYDVLRAHPNSYAQKSLNTGSDADYRKFSPGAISLQAHLDEVGALREAGIYTSIQVNPVVPGITGHVDIRVLFERLAAMKNNHVIVKFAEASFSWVPAFLQRMAKAFGRERAAAFEALFTQNLGGQRTIAEEYRMHAHRLYQGWATELGMTYGTCYEYKAEKGTRGVSIGREMTTAAQCHGPAVPVFERRTPEAAFTAFEYCPPSGCLYCADQYPGGVPCGNEKMGSARALRAGDYKKPLGVQ
jgi:DNA repair photolyase